MRQVSRVHAYYPRDHKHGGRPSFLGSIMARSLDSQRRSSLLDQVNIVLTPPSDRGRYTSAWKGNLGSCEKVLHYNCSASNTPKFLPSRSSNVLSRARRSDQTPRNRTSCTQSAQAPNFAFLLRNSICGGVHSADRFQSSSAASFIFVGTFARKESGQARTSNPGGSVQRKVVDMEFAGVTIPFCASMCQYCTGLVSKYRIVVTRVRVVRRNLK
ncbi:hypothetical protein EDB83DRAFT_271922 [Lactarius deliciosus]|nr:hypothetical protein EDB83DRAFT_271922 [Lactarius deliciosus]